MNSHSFAHNLYRFLLFKFQFVRESVFQNPSNEAGLYARGCGVSNFFFIFFFASLRACGVNFAFGEWAVVSDQN